MGELLEGYSEHSWIVEFVREYNLVNSDKIDKANAILTDALDKITKLNKRR